MGSDVHSVTAVKRNISTRHTVRCSFLVWLPLYKKDIKLIYKKKKIFIYICAYYYELGDDWRFV